MAIFFKYGRTNSGKGHSLEFALKIKVAFNYCQGKTRKTCKTSNFNFLTKNFLIFICNGLCPVENLSSVWFLYVYIPFQISSLKSSSLHLGIPFFIYPERDSNLGPKRHGLSTWIWEYWCSEWVGCTRSYLQTVKFGLHFVLGQLNLLYY